MYIKNNEVQTTKKFEDTHIEEYILNQQNRQFRKSKSKFPKNLVSSNDYVST